MIQFILGAAVLDIAGGIFDAAYTELGIHKGVSTEGNWLIKKLFGNKPSAIQLYIFNFIQTALYAGVATLGVLKGTEGVPYVALGGGIAALLADAFKHVQAGLLWRYLIKGGKLDAFGFPLVNGQTVLHSAFQKFIGPWVW